MKKKLDLIYNMVSRILTYPKINHKNKPMVIVDIDEIHRILEVIEHLTDDMEKENK